MRFFKICEIKKSCYNKNILIFNYKNMTTLELKITDNTMVDTIIKALSKFKCVKIEEKEEEYSEFEKWLISSVKDINAFNKGEKKFWNIDDLLKTL